MILSLDKKNCSKLLSGRFTIGLDASAAREAESPPTVIPMQNSPFRTHQGIVRRLDLNGAMLKPDESGNKALYGKPIKNGEIVGGGAATPAVAQRFVSKLTSLLYPESSTP